MAPVRNNQMAPVRNQLPINKLFADDTKAVALFSESLAEFSFEITSHPVTLKVRTRLLKTRLLSSFSTLPWNPP
ncbi:MAG: hypothetical protein CBE00_06015 [Planctomycetaceae bacterium TMED240]|nr:hypothetical protein [Rhodopirellula sp.]OUX07011.1 MAG: hypothetical protein CBE00_06015 [Planctomycetaceae bacterium TMED240]